MVFGRRRHLLVEAAAVTGFVLAGNTLPRPLVNWVNRRPFDEATTEAQYRVIATCERSSLAEVRDLLDEALARASYPIREIEVLSESENQVELAAILVPTTADSNELDRVVAELDGLPLVLSATWTVGTAV
jgi:putative Mg2+ transporter-C (MgtC) family protein